MAVPSSPLLDKDSLYSNPRISPSSLIERISSTPALSSAVYIYDLAHQAGFGTLTGHKAASSPGEVAPVVHLQTRSGAGLALVGRLSEGTSKDASANGGVITAYTTPVGLSLMAHALSYLPRPTSKSRLVLQVPNVTPVGESLSFSPTLYSLSTALPILPENVVILLSATPQESVDFAGLSYALSGHHVIHIFDHFSSSREQGHAIEPVRVEPKSDGGSVDAAIRSAGYSFFEYSGDAQATNVLVMLNGPLALAAKAIANNTKGLGIIIVKVLRPWDEAALRQVLPASVTKVHILDDVQNAATQGPLYVDVFGALLELPNRPRAEGHRITPSQLQDFIDLPSTFASFLTHLAPPQPTPTTPTFESTPSKKLLFFATPKSPLANLPHGVESSLLSHNGISARLVSDHDLVNDEAGVSVSRIVLSQAESETQVHVPIPFIAPLSPRTTSGSFEFIGVLDSNIFISHSILKYAAHGAAVLIAAPASLEEFTARIPRPVLETIKEKALRVYTVDAENIASQLIGGRSGEETHELQTLVVHLAFFRLYIGNDASEALVYKLARAAFDDKVLGIDLTKVNGLVWGGLAELGLPELETETEEKVHALKEFEFNAIATETQEEEVREDAGREEGSWHIAAKHIIFPGVFTPTPTTIEETAIEPAQDPNLHPEIPDRTFLITCTVNRRLTPLEYDRNVFHLEFDTRNTGLVYKLGEALGVHGWNDEQEVLEFCGWYGVDPQRVITIPVPGTEGRVMQSRTVFQALQQQVDLFGRPPKSFYTDLAPYATKQLDRFALFFIGSPEGAATLKKLGEKDTVTYADVLRRWGSARPGIERLCEMVGDIKPRHYSIASSQEVVGDRIDLLVVSVGWMSSQGKERFGQCTRYLNSLKVGQKVTVSIKPSVMKLPTDPTQPIIMAGLGTGAAPFRAFLQHRAHLLTHHPTTPVGPMYYYFGSRYQAAEYLYGEEIEAFLLDGTLTKAGLAFSRDGKGKVYIQHRMGEDAEVLAGMLAGGQEGRRGVFYLCGPTWPVPDVYDVLVGALVQYYGMTMESAGAYLEGLKEEERYVLEVYD